MLITRLIMAAIQQKLGKQNKNPPDQKICNPEIYTRTKNNY